MNPWEIDLKRSQNVYADQMHFIIAIIYSEHIIFHNYAISNQENTEMHNVACCEYFECLGVDHKLKYLRGSN